MPAVAGVVWLMSPSVRLPHCLFENSGWTHTGSLVDSALCGCCRGSCGGVHRVVVTLSVVRQRKVVWVCWHAVGCLGQHCVFLLLWHPIAGDWPVVVVVGVGCVLCENCIVDASILFFCILCCLLSVYSL